MEFRVRIKPLNAKGITTTLADLSGVEHRVALQAKTDTDPRVPARSGRLASNTQVVKNRIIYPGPYAAPLYFGKRSGYKLQIFTRVHPKAQTFWFWGSKKDNLEKWKRLAAAEIMRKIKK